MARWSFGFNYYPSTLRHGRDEEKVKYLPQKFVERLCAPENNRQLEEEIEKVIFQRISKPERLEASNFRELRESSTQSVQLKRQKLIRTIQSLNQSIADTKARIGLKPSKERELKLKQDELKTLLKTQPQMPQENAAELQQLEALVKKRQQLESAIANLTEQQASLDTLGTKYIVLHDDLSSFNTEVEGLLKKVGLSSEREKFVVRVPPEVPGIIARRRDELEKEIGTLKNGVEGRPEVANLLSIMKQITELHAKSQITETKRKEYDKFQRDRQQLENTIGAFEREIKEISDVLTPRLKSESDLREERYLDALDLLKEERLILEKLYEPLRTALLASNEIARKLTFFSRITFAVPRHANKGAELLDKRKAIYSDQQELEDALKTFFDQIENAGFDREECRKALHALHESFFTQGAKKLKIEDQLRKDRTPKEFADWFYSTDSFSVTYAIKFDGKDLHLLSPGEKGIVLLLLYLEAENEDNRPLIIDQPDDNLDNVSVYPNLIEYFRARKRTRQVIIITHNPNLVVNTDAEQVSVADFDGSRSPKITYRSGSLEDTNASGPVYGIREEVCSILEGGTEAFQLREQRYAIK